MIQVEDGLLHAHDHANVPENNSGFQVQSTPLFPVINWRYGLAS
jgi:hypothetical protein